MLDKPRNWAIAGQGFKRSERPSTQKRLRSLLKEFGHLYHDGIRSEVERRFGLIRDGSVMLQGSHSYVYDYARDGNRTILKITHSTHRRARQLFGELEFTDFLARNGMNVPRPLPSRTGVLVERIDARSGSFFAAAYQKAPGALVDWRAWTPELFKAWGATIGRMHALTKRYEPSEGSLRRGHWHEDRDWDLDTSVPGSMIEWRLRGQRIKDWLMSLPQGRDSYGLIHSDLHQWNILLHGQDLWPIDFDNLRYDWFVSDFTCVLINAIICQAHCFQNGDYDSWTSGQAMDSHEFLWYFFALFLKGYRRENTLRSEWILMLPRFLERHYFTFYFDSLWDGAFQSMPEREQASEFPWRTSRQMKSEIMNGFWEQFDFAQFIS